MRFLQLFVILKQSSKILTMEKQFNPLLSFPVMIKQSIYLANQAKALQIFLKKYSEKEINQIAPIALKEYLRSKQFDQGIAEEASNVLQRYTLNFLQQFSREIRDIQKLNVSIKKTYKCLDQAKQNVKNRKLFQCQICQKQYSTANGLHYHRRAQHAPEKEPNALPVQESQPQSNPSSKKIKKAIVKEKIYNQESESLNLQKEYFLS